MSWLVEIVLNWIASKLIDFLLAMEARAKRSDEIKREAYKSVEPLKKAETAEEIEKATDEALDGF